MSLYQATVRYPYADTQKADYRRSERYEKTTSEGGEVITPSLHYVTPDVDPESRIHTTFRGANPGFRVGARNDVCMAMFREHLAVGALVALAGTGAVFFYALVTDPLLLGLLFVVIVVASFTPDVDSDNSTPFHLIYGGFTIVCTAIALSYALKHYADDLPLLIGIPSAIFLFVWFVVGGVFQAWTRHRGMFHSIPAMIIAALATYLVARSLQNNDMVSLVFAAGAGLGYLAHLVLDEIYAGITLDGTFFTPKRSLGTALKFASSSTLRTLFTYSVLALLVYLTLYP